MSTRQKILLLGGLTQQIPAIEYAKNKGMVQYYVIIYRTTLDSIMQINFIV